MVGCPLIDSPESSPKLPPFRVIPATCGVPVISGNPSDQGALQTEPGRLIVVCDRSRIWVVIALEANARVQDEGGSDYVIHVDTNGIAPDYLIAARGNGVGQTVSSVVFVGGRERVVTRKMDVVGQSVVDFDARDPLEFIGRKDDRIVAVGLVIYRDLG